MNVQNWIIEWFVKAGSLDRQKVENSMDKNYIENGLIDSFGFIQLIADVEDTFDLSFEDKDFADETLLTISGICKKIQELM